MTEIDLATEEAERFAAALALEQELLDEQFYEEEMQQEKGEIQYGQCDIIGDELINEDMDVQLEPIYVEERDLDDQ